MLFANGINGEGAKRGRKGWELPLGDITGANALTFISIRMGSSLSINGVECDPQKSA